MADKENQTSFVYNIIKERILQNELSPGSKINQSKIAKELNVSRTPVIISLHKLETEGLVNNINNKGFFVHQLTVKELLDLFMLRKVIESLVVFDLVKIITPEEVKELKSFFEPFIAVKEIDIKKYWMFDRKFHDRLVGLCQNTLVKQINDNFQVLNRTYSAGFIRNPLESLEEHMAIINGLEQKNAKEARQALITHLSHTEKLLQDVVDNLTNLGVDPAETPVNKFDFFKKNQISKSK